MTDHAKAIAALRAIADLLEARPGLPRPYLSFNFSLYAGKDYDPPATAALIAAAFSGLSWTTRTTTGSNGKDTLWLEANPSHPLSVSISAPAEAMGTQAGKRVVTEWEPLPAIAAILASGTDDR